MAKKKDTRQIEAVAHKFGMSEPERRRFGDYVEEQKAAGRHGKNARGVFTFKELEELAREFLND